MLCIDVFLGVHLLLQPFLTLTTSTVTTFCCFSIALLEAEPSKLLNLNKLRVHLPLSLIVNLHIHILGMPVKYVGVISEDN